MRATSIRRLVGHWFVDREALAADSGFTSWLQLLVARWLVSKRRHGIRKLAEESIFPRLAAAYGGQRLA